MIDEIKIEMARKVTSKIAQAYLFSKENFTSIILDLNAVKVNSQSIYYPRKAFPIKSL